MVFEIGALSCQHISITIEHPYMETMTTIELDLTCMPSIKCNIFSLGGDYSSITSGLSRILQTSISIPVTVRTLLKFWERENSNKSCDLDNSSLSLFCSQGKLFSGNLIIYYCIKLANQKANFHLRWTHSQPIRSIKRKARNQKRLQLKTGQTIRMFPTNNLSR